MDEKSKKNKKSFHLNYFFILVLISFVIFLIKLFSLLQDFCISEILDRIIELSKFIFLLHIFLILLYIPFLVFFLIKKKAKKRILLNFVMYLIFVSSLFWVWFFSAFFSGPRPQEAWKPIIYLYPEQTTNIDIKLGEPEKLSHTYPKYETKWSVIAEPNGTLTDKKGRTYYALYWEGTNAKAEITKEGFLVKGSDTITFLEDKLAILGLSEREANEFIIYWLPKLENNKYNYIRFKTKEEQDAYMPLDVTPSPDTVIRVMMEYAALENPVDITEQKLPQTPKRNGFTVVEWGGTAIK